MFCSQCGNPYYDVRRFCSHCGNQLQQSAPAPQPPVIPVPVYPPVAPVQPVYVPPQPAYVQPAYVQPVSVSSVPGYAPAPVYIPIQESDIPLESIAPPAPAEKGNPMVPIMIMVGMAALGLGTYAISHILGIF